MENFKILKQFSKEQIQRIGYEIRKGIHEVIGEFGRDDSKIIIAVPSYFNECLLRNPRFLETFNPYILSSNGQITMFGYKAVPNYANYIVVFHEDMPLYDKTCFKVINLK